MVPWRHPVDVNPRGRQPFIRFSLFSDLEIVQRHSDLQQSSLTSVTTNQKLQILPYMIHFTLCLLTKVFERDFQLSETD